MRISFSPSIFFPFLLRCRPFILFPRHERKAYSPRPLRFFLSFGRQTLPDRPPWLSFCPNPIEKPPYRLPIPPPLSFLSTPVLIVTPSKHMKTFLPEKHFSQSGNEMGQSWENSFPPPVPASPLESPQRARGSAGISPPPTEILASLSVLFFFFMLVKERLASTSCPQLGDSPSSMIGHPPSPLQHPFFFS